VNDNVVNKDGLSEIEGTVEHIVFQNEENGYTVCELVLSDDDLITAVGQMPFLTVGESIKALGQWTTHPSFGRQFKVEYFEKQLPATENAIRKYLSSGAIKGIGVVLADRIVDKFGSDSFDVIENHPEWLTDISGITKKKAEKISERFREAFGVRSVMMFCREFFGPATAVKVYKKWGGSAVDVIKANPYKLCECIHGIGFETADRIAASLGSEKNNPDRLRAGIIYFLTFSANQNGHTFIPRDKLIPAACSMLDGDEGGIENALEELLSEGTAVSVKFGGREVVYLKDYFEAERYIAAKLAQLHSLCERVSLRDADRFVDMLEFELDITYASMQRNAILNAMESGVMVLTGGPGTGKTTVIRALIAVFEKMGMRIALSAPTGRAAKRMSEATSREAKTVHRLLETEFSGDDKPSFRRGEHDLLDEDVIIVDEASMVDTLLFSSLLKAIKPGARLILVGDADQLPSVGAGTVLFDIIESGKYPSVALTEIFRQAASSLIVRNAHAINRGEMIDIKSTDSDFFFMRRSGSNEIAETVASLVTERLPKKYGEEIINNLQVITPTHKGASGTDNLNILLQARLNPPSKHKAEKKFRERVFRVGDKVMQTKNNYDAVWEKNGIEGVGIFNGDIGVITDIDLKEETITVVSDDRRIVYDFSQTDELELAYAITIHKSQGSEYGTVVLALSDFSPRLLTRNLLYTAVTRAKDMAIAVGHENTVYNMINNDRQVRRYTGLCFLIKTY
jgi:exodeoxyribonuclease V alpha subunit